MQASCSSRNAVLLEVRNSTSSEGRFTALLFFKRRCLFQNTSRETSNLVASRKRELVEYRFLPWRGHQHPMRKDPKNSSTGRVPSLTERLRDPHNNCWKGMCFLEATDFHGFFGRGTFAKRWMWYGSQKQNIKNTALKITEKCCRKPSLIPRHQKNCKLLLKSFV